MKGLKASDLIKNQQRFQESKSLLVNQETKKEKNDACLSHDKNELEDNESLKKTVDFYHDLEEVIKKSRDRKFIDNKIRELDLYKMLSRKAMLEDCKGSSYKTAKSFIQAIEQSQILLERLWKFYA